jgi:hypothetical protein
LDEPLSEFEPVELEDCSATNFDVEDYALDDRGPDVDHLGEKLTARRIEKLAVGEEIRCDRADLGHEPTPCRKGSFLGMAGQLFGSVVGALKRINGPHSFDVIRLRDALEHFGNHDLQLSDAVPEIEFS